MSILTQKESAARDYDGRDLEEINHLQEARIEVLQAELRKALEYIRELEQDYWRRTVD